MPALRLSCIIGFRFGSVESKLGMRRSRKLPGSDVHRLRPGRFVPDSAKASVVSSERYWTCQMSPPNPPRASSYFVQS